MRLSWENIAKASGSAFGDMSPSDAKRYNQFWDDVAKGKTVDQRMGVESAIEWKNSIDDLKKQGVEVVEKSNGTMGNSPKSDLYPPQLNIDADAS